MGGDRGGFRVPCVGGGFVRVSMYDPPSPLYVVWVYGLALVFLGIACVFSWNRIGVERFLGCFLCGAFVSGSDV